MGSKVLVLNESMNHAFQTVNMKSSEAMILAVLNAI